MVKQACGFTLIELMIVVTIAGILAAISYPSYTQYKKRTHRSEVQAEMMNIAQRLESHKLANYKYLETATVSSLFGTDQFPKTGTSLYKLDFDTISANTWILTATPISTSLQKDDGVSCINDRGQRYWAKTVTTAAACIALITSTSNWDGR